MSIHKLQPRDLIAIIVIIGGMILVSFGIDKIVGGILVMIISFYFGLNTPKPQDEKNGQSDTAGRST